MERDNLEDLDVDENVILKRVLNKCVNCNHVSEDKIEFRVILRKAMDIISWYTGRLSADHVASSLLY
jgi:hypothetical protein